MSDSNNNIIDEWRMSARCIGLDQDIFFPQRGESVNEAKKVCDLCVVATECLEDALVRRESAGVRAGLSTTVRRRIIRKRKDDWDAGKATI